MYFITLALLFLTHLALPFLFLFWLSFNKGKNRIYKISILLFVSSFLFVIKIIGAGWYWLGVWWPFLFIALLIPAYFFGLKNFRSLPWFPPKKFSTWLGISMLFIVASFLVSIIPANKYKEKPIKLQFPLNSGNYYITHGGDSPVINPHYYVPAQKHALDIVKLNSLGFRAKGLLPTSLNAYNIFGDKVFSPCSGEVLSVENQIEDNKIFNTNKNKPIGNHVILYCKEHTIVLAHLKKNSVPVSIGDFTQKGDLIGQVGNSGNSSEPHLHIHAIKGKIKSQELWILKGNPIPLIFNNKFLVRTNQWKSSKDSRLKAED